MEREPFEQCSCDSQKETYGICCYYTKRSVIHSRHLSNETISLDKIKLGHFVPNGTQDRVAIWSKEEIPRVVDGATEI